MKVSNNKKKKGFVFVKGKMLSKITRTHRQLNRDVTKEPRITSKELQASVKASDSRRKKKDKNKGKKGHYGIVPRRKKNDLLCRLKTTQRLALHILPSWCSRKFWLNVMWTQDTKEEYFERCAPHFISCKTNTLYFGKRREDGTYFKLMMPAKTDAWLPVLPMDCI